MAPFRTYLVAPAVLLVCDPMTVPPSFCARQVASLAGRALGMPNSVADAVLADTGKLDTVACPQADRTNDTTKYANNHY